MSYQFEPANCGPVHDDDYHSQQIQQDIQAATSIISAIANFAVNLFSVFLPIILAVGIVYLVAKDFNFATFLIIVLLAIFFYIFQHNMTGSNLAGSLPPATYPIPPHLGLDGISLENRTCLTCRDH